MRLRPVVLLVDDTPQQLDLYEMALADRYTVVRATTAEAAYRAAITGRPDVIVLDVLMPGEDGLTLCARLKTDPLTAPIPVLLLTASDGVDLEARAIAAQARLVLRKPCSADRLSQVIDAVATRPHQPAA